MKCSRKEPDTKLKHGNCNMEWDKITELNYPKRFTQNTGMAIKFRRGNNTDSFLLEYS